MWRGPAYPYPMYHRPYSRERFIFYLLVGLMIALFASFVASAFDALGIPWWGVIILVILSFAGSTVNIPLFIIESIEKIREARTVTFFWMTYYIPPAYRKQETLIAINVGGAVVPIIASFYLIILNIEYLLWFVLAIFIVATLTYPIAQPVPGLGITMPFFIPPFIAALTAIFLAFFAAPSSLLLLPAMAYVGGSMGTLIGADLLHLPDIPKLGAPVASIGGAGTWDGIFLSGLVATLLVPV